MEDTLINGKSNLQNIFILTSFVYIAVKVCFERGLVARLSPPSYFEN